MPRHPLVPPVLYLPVRESSDGPVAEVRRLADGRSTLLAYTALDRLAVGCGESQPWVVMHTQELSQLKDSQPFEVVSFDVEVPAVFRANGRLA